jgi:hypothetical protein
LAKPSSGGIWDAREPPRWGHPNATSGQLDHLPASVRWSSLAGPSHPRWLWSRRGLNGPQVWSTVRRRDRRGCTESAAGQWFLIGEASLGWNPSLDHVNPVSVNPALMALALAQHPCSTPAGEFLLTRRGRGGSRTPNRYRSRFCSRDSSRESPLNEMALSRPSDVISRYSQNRLRSA